MSSIVNRNGVWYLVWQDCDGRQMKRSTRIRLRHDPQGKLARQVQRDHDTRSAKVIAGVEDHRISVREGFSGYLGSIRQTSEQYRIDCASRARIVGQIRDTETFAVGGSIRELKRLQKVYGKGL